MIRILTARILDARILNAHTLTARMLTALVIAAFSAPSHAAPPSTESVEQVLQLSRIEAMLDTMYAGMEQIMRASMQEAMKKRPALTPEQQRFLDQMPARFTAVIREEVGWKTMKPMYVKIYQETFEQEEIDGLIQFYRSPVGQAMLDKMPQVMQRSTALTQERMRTLMPRISRVVEDAMREAEAMK